MSKVKQESKKKPERRSLKQFPPLSEQDFEFLAFEGVFQYRGRLYPLHDLRIPEDRLTVCAQLQRQAELDRLRNNFMGWTNHKEES